MTLRHRHPRLRTVRPGESHASIRGWRMLVASLLLAMVTLGAGATAAWADEAPPPEASATPAPSPAPTDPPPSLTITGPTDGFSPKNSVTFSGKKTAGSSIAVTGPGGSVVCSVLAADAPLVDWSCTATLPNGPDQVFTATETLADGTAGESATTTVDVLGPPTITAEPPQQSPGVASGTGFPDSKIVLFVNGTPQTCNAFVTATGDWLCTIAGGPGTYNVQAVQTATWGTAARESNPSAQRTIVVNPAPPAETTPPPTTPPAPQPAPVLPPPAPTPPDEPEPEPSPSPTPHERTDAGTLPWLDRPLFPGPGGGGPTAREALTNWGTPTGFGSQLPTPGETVAGSNWLWAPLFAVAFIGLIAIPLRLLANSLRGRFTFRKPQFAGRNREPTAAAAEPIPRNPWLMGAIPLAATAGLIVLAEGLNGEVRYLRLIFAVGAGLALLNVVGVAISSRIASGRMGISGRLRFLPILLVIAAIATLISRFMGMEPPLVGGVLIAAGFALGVPVRPRAFVGLAQVGGILVLALLGWVAHGLVGPVDGFWASVLSETLATVCLAGLGSALILMLPIGGLPGRVVFEWSPAAWVASALVVGTAAAAILEGGVQTAIPTLAAVLAVAGFAAVCVAVWAWSNYVEASRA